ncbi:MAG: protein ImuB [Sphingomonadales bacterium]|nr:protein ImuB [Sphingomonadales bacterium]
MNFVNFAPEDRPPLLLSHRVGNRLLIAAASPEARALGLAPGMAVSQARALVPGLDVRDHDPAADEAALTRLAFFAARRWTPRAAVSPPDGLFLDLSGVAHLFGGEERMCRRILAFCARAGFAARIAVAGTPGAAHALARFGGGPFCPPGGEAGALAPLPLAALRVGEPVLAAARRLGLERIGDLLTLPRGPLQRRFGKTLLARLDQALGRAGEPIEPVVPEDPPEAILRFAEPIATAEAIAEALRLLMSRLIATLREAGLAARTLALLCERVDGKVERIAIGTARATRDGDHLLRLLAMKIETIEPGFGLDSIRLVAGRVEPLAPEQPSLRAKRSNPAALAPEAGLPRRCAPRNDESEADLAVLVDRLAGRLGPRRLYRATAVESDVPERSVARTGPLDPALPWPKWPRPVRLLSPPERIDNVVALLPDLPPRRFTWRGRAYRVARADGPERIHGEWWKRRAEAEAVRDYFQVEDEEGARFWLFRRGDGVDQRTGDLSWYLHGVFG